MNSLISYSLSEYIMSLIDSIGNVDKSLQLKIPGKDYSCSIILEVLETVSNNVLEGTDVDIKIAYQLMDEWSKHAELDVLMQDLKKNHSDWIDVNGNLTVYRNQLGANCDHRSILIIVGSDFVDDKSSLSHFFDLGINSLFREKMHSSCSEWIEIISDNMYITSGGSEKLLECILDYTDLIHLDEFLSSLDYGNYLNMYQAIGSNLYELGLPNVLIAQNKNIKKDYKKAIEIFSGTYGLDDTKVRKSVAYINKLKDRLSDDTGKRTSIEEYLIDYPEYYSVYSDVQNYLDDCIAVIQPDSSPDVKNRLIQTDVYTLVEKVFQFKPKSASPRLSVTKVYGMPMEAILNALWLSLDNFECNSDSQVTHLSILPIRFYHNRELDLSADTGEFDYIRRDVIIPLLGGLDSILEQRILDELRAFPMFENTEFCVDLESDTNWDIKKTNSIPYFTFRICLANTLGDRGEFDYRYDYREDTAVVYSLNLLRTVRDICPGYCGLPAFGMNKYQEMFDKPEDEVNLFFSSEISKKESLCVYDLIKHEDIEDAKLDIINNVVSSFQKFVDAVFEYGLYKAVLYYSAVFCNKYKEMLDSFACDQNPKYSAFKNKLIRCFWIIETVKDEEFLATKDFGSGIVSIIHPAMIDMFNMQMNYLLNSFVSTFKEVFVLNDGKGNFNHNTIFNQMLDYASLMSPIPCMVNNDEKILDVRGNQLLYMLGTPDKDETARPSSIICKYEDEDGITDAIIVKDTQQSVLVSRLLKDYFDTYMMARASLRIAALFCNDIHSMLSGVLKYWKDCKSLIRDQLGSSEYEIDLIFYTLPQNEMNTVKWINTFEEFISSKKQAEDDKYNNLNIKLRCQMLSESGIIEQLKKLGFDADLTFCFESSEVMDESIDFEVIQNIDNSISDVTVKFPLVKKVLPKRMIEGGAKGSQRRRTLVSNRQFDIYSSYLKYLYCGLRGTPLDNSDVIIVEETDFSSWNEIFKYCLGNSERVIAVGHNVDKGLIKGACGKDITIIGSGSGVGANADLNYVVVSDMLSYGALRKRLKDKFKAKIAVHDKVDEIVDNMMLASQSMADLSLVKTLSCKTMYSHDFFGYSMIRHLLKAQSNCFTDVVLSMDSYKHWFKFDESRADLLWVRAVLSKDIVGNDIFKLQLDVVESKLGENVCGNLLAHATVQAEETYQYLKERFIPRGHNDRYDSKFWWMQLHRIIASNSDVDNDAIDPIVKAALENLADGHFDVSMNRYVIGFETTSLYGKKLIAVYSAEIENEPVLTELVFTPLGLETYLSKPMEKIFEEFVHDVTGQDMEEITYSAEDVEFQRKKENSSKENEEKSIDAVFGGKSDDPYIVEKDYLTYDSLNSIEKTVDVEIHSGDSIEGEYKEDINNNEIDPVNDVVEKEELEDDRKAPLCAPSYAKVLLGKDVYGNEVYWNYGRAFPTKNKHLLVLGASGSGKTYAIQCILYELAKFGQASFILDYTNGFAAKELKPQLKKYTRPQHYVLKNPLPLNPFLQADILLDEEDEDSLTKEDAFATASRVVDIICHKFTLGEVQKSLLKELIEDGINTYGEDFSMSKLYDMISEYSEDKSGDKSNYKGIKARLMPLAKCKVFAQDSENKDIWDKIFYDGDVEKPVSVFQFKGMDSDVTLTSVDFVLWDIYEYAIRKKSSEQTPHTIVLDEFQNLQLSNDESPVRKILQEGRKLGLGLIFATQLISGIKDKDGAAAVASTFNASTVLFFSPTSAETKAFAEQANMLDPSRSRDEWVKILSGLKKGECVVMAEDEQGKRRGKVVKITSLEER